MIDELITILLVEDEEAHAELIQRAFEYRGDQVSLAITHTLTEAKQWLEQAPQSLGLIIADWRLPDGDSLELLCDSTENEQESIPIIIMTSQGNERVAVEALKAGALDYVVKSQETLLDMPHIAERTLREWKTMSEHQRISEALRQSEAQFRLLAENSSDLIARHDIHGNCLYASPACKNVMGFTGDELVGKSIYDFIHKEDLTEIRTQFESLAESPILQGVVFRLLHKDGYYNWIETSCRLVVDPETKIPEVHSSSRDVTARIKAEIELRASEDRFRSLVQNSDDLITVVDENGIIIYDSPSVTRITGYQSGEMIRKSAFDFIHSDDFETASLELQNVIKRTEDGIPTELRFKTADGRWIYLEVLGTNLLEHPGIGGIVLTSRDVTQRKQAALELQKAHENLSAAYDETILGWSRALDLRDKETEGHTLRVTEMSIQLATELGLDDEMKHNIRHGALLHDMGKMGIPDEILQKPGPLDDKEWEIMRKHPEYAFQMLSDIDYLKSALNIPYCHHEWWDGSGYPRQLKGEQIPIEARLFSIIDVWDALTVDRPYRNAWSKEKAIEYIKENAGKQFDPHIVNVFLELLLNHKFNLSEDPNV